MFVAVVFDRLKQMFVLPIVTLKGLPSLQMVTVSTTPFSTPGVPFCTRHDSSGFFHIFLCCKKI
jgi:hypothetical protein